MFMCAVIFWMLQNDDNLVTYRLHWMLCIEALTTAWTKFYCQYQKDSRSLVMVAYNQTVGKGTSDVSYLDLLSIRL